MPSLDLSSVLRQQEGCILVAPRRLRLSARMTYVLLAETIVYSVRTGMGCRRSSNYARVRRRSTARAGTWCSVAEEFLTTNFTESEDTLLAGGYIMLRRVASAAGAANARVHRGFGAVDVELASGWHANLGPSESCCHRPVRISGRCHRIK